MKYVSISTADRKWLLLNYGGFLQHFALRVVLKKMGFTPYRVDNDGVGGEIKAFFSPFKWMASNILSLISPTRKWRHINAANFWLHRIRFICDYRKLIGPLFEVQAQRRFAALVGGGQAWSIYCQNRPDLYWENVDDDVRCVAYSVSSAWIALSDNESWLKRVEKACRRANAVSLRERAGVSLCSSLVPDKDFCKTLDPVFLLMAEEYGEYLPQRKIFDKDTVFSYLLEVRDAEYVNEDSIRKLATELGCDCKMVGIQGAEYYVPHTMSMNPGPIDFLRCCRDSRYIVTNSFHGAVLALVFHKNFVFVQQHDPRNNGNANLRQTELLNEFGLSDRILSAGASVADMLHVLKSNINWMKIDESIQQKRRFSLEFIEKSLA